MQKDAKEACERALEAKIMPLDIALENLNTREGRQEFDVVKDEVENQLNTEVQLIENIKEALKVFFSPKLVKFNHFVVFR